MSWAGVLAPSLGGGETFTAWRANFPFSHALHWGFFGLVGSGVFPFGWGAAARHLATQWPCWPQQKHLMGDPESPLNCSATWPVLDHLPSWHFLGSVFGFCSVALRFLYHSSSRSIASTT